MKISLHQETQSIAIKDDLQTQFFALKFLMVLNIFNALLITPLFLKGDVSFVDAIWFGLGLASAVILYIFVFKRSTKKNIPFSEIVELKKTRIIGRKKYHIILSNGKKRPFYHLKTSAEIEELKQLFEAIQLKKRIA